MDVRTARRRTGQAQEVEKVILVVLDPHRAVRCAASDDGGPVGAGVDTNTDSPQASSVGRLIGAASYGHSGHRTPANRKHERVELS